MPDFYTSIITVVGLNDAPDKFVRSLSKKMFEVDLDNLEPSHWGFDPGVTSYQSLIKDYMEQGQSRFGILYPEKPFELLGIMAPRFYVETKYEPPIDELRRASNRLPELPFHLKWRGVVDGPSGEVVLREGQSLNELCRPFGSGLFYDVLYPAISLLPAHLPYTLAQRASLQIQHAIDMIAGLAAILDDHRFRHSESRPFSDCRDLLKTNRVRADLGAICRSLVKFARDIDFERVFLEEEELVCALPRVIEEDKRLMRNLGLRLVSLDPGTIFTLRPFKWAHLVNPDRIIVPAVTYMNPRPELPDEQPRSYQQHFKWETGYLCLHSMEMRSLGRVMAIDGAERRLCGVYFTVAKCSHRFGYDFEFVSREADWNVDMEVAKTVGEEAAKMEVDFAARLANVRGAMIFDCFGEPNEEQF